MAKPLIPVDVIYEHALALIDAEGARALNARRLASDLKCSTRTLYQQVGNREELIRALVGRHFSQLQLDFHEYDTWGSTAVQWSLALHDALQAHPFLTELMNVDDRGAVTSYVDKLLKSLVQGGNRPPARHRLLPFLGEHDDQSHHRRSAGTAPGATHPRGRPGCEETATVLPANHRLDRRRSPPGSAHDDNHRPTPLTRRVRCPVRVTLENDVV
jgi:AcrR family transcriptional regulator